MQSYSAQPIIVEPVANMHPVLTLIGVLVLVFAAYWIIASLGAKKGKKPSPKASKSAKKAPARS